MKKHLFLLLAFFLCALVAWGQNSVQGTVFSETDNEPVIGANVMVKGTTNGTITDLEGYFIGGHL